MNDLLVCSYNKCNKYLVEPVILTCSNHICKSHFDELIKDKNEEQFKCLVCNDDHDVPKNGLTPNSMALKMIGLNLHLNENEKKVSESIDKLRKDIDKFDAMVKDPESFIFDYISATRNKIDLERVRLVKEINALSDEMLARLKHYENECKKNLQYINICNEQHKAYLTKLTNQMSNMREEMRIPHIQQARIDQLFNETNQMIKDVTRRSFEFKKLLMMNKSCSFKGRSTKFDEKIFGELVFSNKINYETPNSIGNNFKSLILCPSQFADLIKLCDFGAQSEFKLLYKASGDGFSTTSFHSKCDGVPNTLTIIKVKGEANVFGGFCSVTWDGSWYKSDPKAFIYSLINKDNRPLKINVAKPFYAIYCKSDYGPTFGDDINIFSDSNRNQQSYSNFGDCYQNEHYTFGTAEAKNFLAGSFTFTTEEIEVYQVI